MGTVLPIPRQIGQAQRASMKIGDLARRAGKSARAVRLYEDLGLLGAPARTEGGHRIYADDALLRLGWIDKLQLLGFSLHEIRTFLDDLEAANKGPLAMERVRDIFSAKLAEVRAQIKALGSLAEELEEGLSYLKSCTTCDPTTLLGECRSCEHPHTNEPPVLITGIHTRGEGK